MTSVQKRKEDSKELEKECFHHPFTMVVSGSTGSGKTVWVMRLLKHINSLIIKDDKSDTITAIMYCYGELNDTVLNLKRLETANSNSNKNDEYFKEITTIKTINGLPTEDVIQNEAQQSGRRLLLVLDDLMVAAKSPFLDTVFALGSHNWGVSVVLVTQHLFSKEVRVARNNAHYIVLLRNPAGALQIRNLAGQLFPTQTPYFMEAYYDATKEQFSYLLIDMHPVTKDALRLKTHIYPEEGWTIVYIPKGAQNQLNNIGNL